MVQKEDKSIVYMCLGLLKRKNCAWIICLWIIRILLYYDSKAYEFNNYALNVLKIIISIITAFGRNQWFCFERKYCGGNCELNRTF
jgi:hypothetical protein